MIEILLEKTIIKKIIVCIDLVIFADFSLADDCKFQAFPIPPRNTTGAEKVFIIDSHTGKIWTWTEPPLLVISQVDNIKYIRGK